jgi:hypothetical protein
VGTEAEVGPTPAKRDVVVWGSLQVQDMRIVGHRLVEVGRCEVEGDLLPRFDLRTVQGHVAGCDAPVEMDRRRPSDRFVRCPRPIRRPERSSSHCPGKAANAAAPDVMVCLVVSLPATTRSTKYVPSFWSLSGRPSTSPRARAVITSSEGRPPGISPLCRVGTSPACARVPAVIPWRAGGSPR